MSDRSAFPDVDMFRDHEMVSEVKFGESYLLVSSTENVTSTEYREFLSKPLVDTDGNYGLEIRAKENEDGFVGILSAEPEHPVQKATIYCGYLGLDDSKTYQILVKTTELVDSELFKSEDYGEFAASVIQVVSISFKPEPYETSYLCKAFNLDATRVNNNTKRIVEHIQ